VPPAPLPSHAPPREGVGVRAVLEFPFIFCSHAACDACGHRVAVALVPFVIRWGADASSDMLRQHARCSVCGQRGATLQHPSWADGAVGWQVFPT
jgi:hypothetical protein